MTNEQEQGGTQSRAAGEQQTATGGQPNLEEIPRLALKVITNPVGFYQGMEKSGGYPDPLIFMVVLAVIAGVLSAVLSLLGLGMAGVMVGGMIAIILVPIFVVIFGFVGAAIAYVIWKMMGSQEDFETAFRCVAYTAAIAPVNALLNVIPYLGSIVSALWPMALLAIASIHVHRRGVRASWAVFGVIGIIFALISVSGESANRRLAGEMENWQDILEERRR